MVKHTVPLMELSQCQILNLDLNFMTVQSPVGDAQRLNRIAGLNLIYWWVLNLQGVIET